MFNPFADIDWKPDKVERRKFAASLVIGFPVVGCVLLIAGWLTTHAWRPFPIWLGLGGAAIGAILWICPGISRPFYLAWYFIACCMGFVVTNILFSTLFFLVVTPIGLVRRRNHPAIQKSTDRQSTSYWEDAEKRVDSKRYYRQF